MKTDFVALCPQRLKRGPWSELGGPQKVGDGPSLAARGLLTIVSLKYWHSQLMPVYSDRGGITSDGLYTNSRFKEDARCPNIKLKQSIVVDLSSNKERTDINSQYQQSENQLINFKLE